MTLSRLPKSGDWVPLESGGEEHEAVWHRRQSPLRTHVMLAHSPGLDLQARTAQPTENSPWPRLSRMVTATASRVQSAHSRTCSVRRGLSDSCRNRSLRQDRVTAVLLLALPELIRAPSSALSLLCRNARRAWTGSSPRESKLYADRLEARQGWSWGWNKLHADATLREGWELWIVSSLLGFSLLECVIFVSFLK